jgi:hypothetical protein
VQKVNWIGPDGEINSRTNEDLQELLIAPALSTIYDEEEIYNNVLNVTNLLGIIRELYTSYKLSSTYHNFGHNYVTTITAVRAFIGSVMRGEIYKQSDLFELIVASLLHDIGYLIPSEKLGKADVVTHAKKGFQLTYFILQEKLKLPAKFVKKIINYQRFADYLHWEENVNAIRLFPLAKLLIGADLLQVTDRNYLKNAEVLQEIMFSKEKARNQESEIQFFKLVKEGTEFVWDDLDEFYAGEVNPYKRNWLRFEKDFRKKYKIVSV